jgi:peptidoglycan/LPS O-acetylase OafA/YrhL
LGRLRGLDLIRFSAALLVMMFHLTVVSWNLPGMSPNYGVSGAPRYPEFSFMSVGWVGVEIFFVLSGLVIAQSANGKSAFQFLRSRLGRLLPGVWICSFITLLVIIGFEVEPVQTALPNFFRSMVVHRNGPWISGVYWTLVVETFFYAAIFVMLWLNIFRHIEKFAILLGIYSSAYLIGITYLGWHRISNYLLGQHGCFFSLGILIWLYVSKGPSIIRLLFGSVFLIAGLFEICMVGNGRLTGYELWAAPFVWFASVVAICLSQFNGAEGNRLTSQLGLMTYPLYLVHELSGAVVLRINFWVGKYLALGAAIMTMAAVSWLVVQAEPPVRALIEASLGWIARNIAPSRLVASLSKQTAEV